MIIEVLCGPTFYWQFKPSKSQGVKAHRIGCRGEASRIDDKVLLMSIVSEFNWDDFSNGITHVVLKSETKYKVITDGSLDLTELYEVYEHAMICLLRGLREFEVEEGMQPTKDIELLPLTGDFLDIVQSQLHEFNMGRKII